MADENEGRHYFGETVEISGVRDDMVLVRRYDAVTRGPVVSVIVSDDDGQPAMAWLDRTNAVKLATALLDAALECDGYTPSIEIGCPECGGEWVEHGGGRRSRQHAHGCSVGR